MRNNHSLTDFDEESRRTIGAWTVFVVLFLVFESFLYTQGELTIEFIGLYWSVPVIVTAIGVINVGSQSGVIRGSGQP
jgi:uncharacterized integral membrane protein